MRSFKQYLLEFDIDPGAADWDFPYDSSGRFDHQTTDEGRITGEPPSPAKALVSFNINPEHARIRAFAELDETQHRSFMDMIHDNWEQYSRKNDSGTFHPDNGRAIGDNIIIPHDYAVSVSKMPHVSTSIKERIADHSAIQPRSLRDIIDHTQTSFLGDLNGTSSSSSPRKYWRPTDSRPTQGFDHLDIMSAAFRNPQLMYNTDHVEILGRGVNFIKTIEKHPNMPRDSTSLAATGHLKNSIRYGLESFMQMNPQHKSIDTVKKLLQHLD